MKDSSHAQDSGKSRRRLLAGLGIISFFSFLNFFKSGKKSEVIECSPPAPGETKKLLAQDGQLVEVDLSKIRILQKKISDQELQQWIKRKQ
jgi:hypothetical protein